MFFKDAMMWRNIGPFRGGRSLTAVGVPSKPLTYYFGSVGVEFGKLKMLGLFGKIFQMDTLKLDPLVH